jgi:hypothetical protein
MPDELAVSSTAPDPISASDALASLSVTERSAWRETGALPADKIAVIDAASPAAEPDVQVAPEGAETASKPVIVPKKKNADTRVDELLADRAEARSRADRLERENETLRRTAVPAVDATKAAPSPAAETDAEPTDATKFATYELFLQAQARWAVRQELAADHKAARAHEEGRRQSDAQHQRATTFSTQLTEARTADPTFLEKVSPEILGLKPFAALIAGEAPSVDNAIAEELIDSPVAAPLMVHLSTHPDDLAKLRACQTPRALARAVGLLEAQYAGKVAAAAPLLKTIPGAPAPPVTIGTRPAASADPVESAISRRDQASYNREMNARELAAK